MNLVDNLLENLYLVPL